MEVKKHENQNITLNLRVDKKRYDWFLKKIKETGQRAEFDSNPNCLNFFVSTHFQKIPYAKVGGICSRVIEDSGEILEVVFLDFDNALRWIVESECKFLVDSFSLSPFYMWTTSEKTDEISGKPYGNYHAISISKCNFRRIIEMQKHVHTLDPAYPVIPKIFKYKTWVLRQSNKGKRGKPRFIGVVGDINKAYNQPCSNAHREFIEGIYPEVPKIKYTNLDKHSVKDLFLTEYLTAAGVKEKKETESLINKIGILSALENKDDKK